jgi:hypothetical protein
MQDRSPQFDEIFLQRMAGPYNPVTSAILNIVRLLPICPDKQTSSASVGMSQLPEPGQLKSCMSAPPLPLDRELWQTMP